MVDSLRFGDSHRDKNVFAERDLLASIVEFSDDAIIGKSLDGTILTWNAAAEKMYGISADQAIGKSILKVVPPDRLDEIPQILAKIKNGETIEHYETKRMGRAGQQIDVSVTVSPIKSASGEIVGASTIPHATSVTANALRRHREKPANTAAASSRRALSGRS